MVNNFIHVVEAYEDDKQNDKIELGMYYFGGSDDGSMKTGSQTVKDDNDDSFKFYFGTKDSGSERKGVGITGNKNNKLYYMGHLVAADDYKYQPVKMTFAVKDEQGNVVDQDFTFIVNQNGSIQHSNVEYKEDGDVLINAKNEKDSAGNDLKVAFETAGQYKYAVTPGTVGNVEFYVDYLDPEVIMSTSDSEDITASVPTVLNAIAE